jgi:O-acetyl-ADP-ribose deacetylase (regulator of RNase III)
VVPLALCEWMLDSLASPVFNLDGNPVYSKECADCIPLKLEIVEGDLLDQEVDVIVNAWNRNFIPWWLLLRQGVSGAIKRRGGNAPFKEIRKHGLIPLGGAVLTSAGTLAFKGIIHVAGINMLWRATERSIRDSVRNAIGLAHEKGFKSIAFPLIGAGSGGFNQERAKTVMLSELGKLNVPMIVKVVIFRQPTTPPL